MSWSIRVPIFKNSLILKQLGLAIGIPFGILAVVLIIFEGYYALMLIGATFVLAFLLVLIIFRGTYDVEYVLTDTKVLCRNQYSQRKKVQGLSKLLFWLGLLRGNPTAAGIGMMSGSRTSETLSWSRVRKVRYDDRSKIIYIKGGLGDSIVLFCGEDNYPSVKDLVKAYTNK